MEGILKRFKIDSLVAAVLSVALGIIFIVFRQGIADLSARIMGIIVLIGGLVFLVTYFLTKQRTIFDAAGLVIGVSTAAMGGVILANPRWFEETVVMVLGVMILISGFESVMAALGLWRRGESLWWPWLVLSLFTVAAGFFLIINRFEVTAFVVMFGGIVMIFDGVVSFIVGLKLSRLERMVKEYKQDRDAIDVGSNEEP